MAGGKLVLTGKALEDFRVWFRKEVPLYDFRIRGWIMGTDDFFNLPAGMQWGMYVDFFETHEIFIIIYPMKHFDGTREISWIIEDADGEMIEEDHTYRGHKKQDEARIAALESAADIYNTCESW